MGLNACLFTLRVRRGHLKRLGSGNHGVGGDSKFFHDNITGR
jgi:hypothetical protein